MNIDEYSLVEATRRGTRDGKDCALLDREINNPYEFGTAEYDLYKTSWKDGYDQEKQFLLH